MNRRARLDRVPAALLSVVALITVAIALGACTPPEPSAVPATPTPSVDPSATGPKPTPWPTGVIEAAIALGAADGDFAKVGSDLDAAIASGDLEQLLVVSENVVAFIEGNQPNVTKLQGYPGTQALGDALEPAYGAMLEGATGIRDALLVGDADAVQAAFETFVGGGIAYSALRQQVNDAAVQALFMKRTLVR